MHTPQFHDSIYTSFPGQPSKFPLFLRIGHAQTQRLHVSIKLRNRIEQIVHFQDCQGSTEIAPEPAGHGLPFSHLASVRQDSPAPFSWRLQEHGGHAPDPGRRNARIAQAPA
jgi:hypothetical protein